MPETAAESVLSLQQWRERGQYFTHHGHRHFYISEGQGPAVILLHGFITSSWDWSLVWPLLTQRFRLIALDYLGFGFSDKPKDADDEEYMTVGRADSVLALARHLGVAEAHLVASGFSVSVVQELLQRQQSSPEHIQLNMNSVCLTNGGLLPVVNRPKFGQRLLLSRLGTFVGRFIRPAIMHRNLQSVCGDKQFSGQRLNEYWSQLKHNNGQLVLHRTIRYLKERATVGEQWTEALCAAQMPVRLIWGGHPNDTVSGRSTLEEYGRLVPAADTVLLPDVGHYPHIEAPQQFAQHLIEFVQPVPSQKTEARSN